ncbi:MAG: phage baseplate plug protein [Weissella confusa]
MVRLLSAKSLEWLARPFHPNWSKGKGEVMALRAYIDVNVAKLPEIFEIELGGVNVYLQFNYNDYGEFYTVDLYDNSMVPIVLGEKLVYGRRLWADYTNPAIPAVDIMPFDESQKETAVSPDNFGKTVFLYLMTLKDDGELM